MKLLYLECLILLVLPGFIGWAQELTPPIQNYTSVEYAAASQNWDVAIDEAGIIYIANNQGLLSYNGQQWELFPLKTGSIIRSVYAHNDRIYTGSYREFGYWSRNNTGEMFYTSLIPLLKEHKMQSEEFWEILSFNDAIYFRSFGTIYKYHNEIIEPVFNLVTNEMLVFNDKLLLAVGKRGLFYLEENGDITALPDQDVFQGQTVVDMEVDGDSLLIGTRDALYVFDGINCKKYNNEELNENLNRSELNHIMRLDEDLILGTVKNGVIHYNQRTGKITIYNRNNGLQNNTILGMARKNGKIWLGLDNGIDVINLNSPVDFYTDDTGELGTVYDLAVFGSTLYLASNTGVYEFNNNKFSLVEGAEGHSWNLEVLDGKLFSNHNTGTFKIDNSQFIPVETRTGSFNISKPPVGENQYIIGNYTGISSYSPGLEGTFEFNNVNFPVQKIVFESQGVLWASHPYEGIYRIGLDNNRETTFVEKMGDLEEEGNYKADVFKINNQIAVFKNNLWYKYNSFLNKLELFKELEDYENHKLLLEDKNAFWFTNTLTNSIIYTDFKTIKVNLAFSELNKRLVKGHENLIRKNDSIYYVTLNDGFGRINLKEMLRINENLNAPIIYGISDSNGRYDLSEFAQIPYKNARAITIGVALPDCDAIDLFYELEGSSGQKGEVEKGIINFQNLSYGNYTLKLFALSPQEVSSGITSIDFEVLAPWYLSNQMKLVYVFILLCIVGLIYWYNRRKLKKHQWVLEQKLNKEHEERLNKLEKERLMNEINSKRKELANTTMIGAKKNEVLMEIQGELNKDKHRFSNQFRLKHIMNKINQAIKNKDEWQLFETNFNEVHEDFSRDLLREFPVLSNKDLKLCSYLKMNLTSKEIAPLMGISVRGIEVHRYRLRKKMDLDKKENLTNFLIKNF